MAKFNLLAELTKARKGHDLLRSDLVSIDQLTDSNLELIFSVTEVFQRFIASGEKKTDILRGKSIINFFNENSTRTRSSFELAGKHLGADVVNVSGGSSSTKKGETIGDTARTLDAYSADLLIIRDDSSGVPYQMAKLVGAPVVNAGDGQHEHPTQALLEWFTLRQRFGKKKLTYLFVGDALHSRVFGSQVRLYKRLGYEMRLAAPATLVPSEVENFGVKVFYKIEDALKDVDAVHAIRLQTERAAAGFVPTPREYSKNYCLNPMRVALMQKDGVVLHAGPVIREFDIRTEVLESERSLVQTLVENGLPVKMALEWLIITRAGKKPNPWKNF